jgi:hypothetical protein
VVVRLIFFPCRFFCGRFWAFLDEGDSKTRLKKTRNRTSQNFWANKVRAFIAFSFFLLPLVVTYCQLQITTASLGSAAANAQFVKC